MGRSEPLTSELRSDFMTESFVDRYLRGVLVFSFVKVELRQNRCFLYVARASKLTGFALTIEVRASGPVR